MIEIELSQLSERVNQLEQKISFNPEYFFNAKGELLTVDSNNHPTLLSIGSDDDVLVVDSGETSGFIYRTISDLISGALLSNDGDILTVDSGLVALAVGSVNQYLGNDGSLLEWKDLPIIVESSGLKANVAVDTIGTKAVMLQKEFSVSTQSAKGDYSGLLSGYRNSITATGDYGVIAGGSSNTVNSARGSIFSGHSNSLNGDYSTILQGQSNSIDSNSLYSSIINGISNSITNSGANYYNLVLTGALNTLSNGLLSVILSGYDCDIVGSYSVILSGQLSTINANYSTAIGNNLDIDSNYTFVIGNPGGTITFNRANSFWIYDMVSFTYRQEYKIEDSEFKNQLHSSYIWDDTLVVRYKNSAGTVKTAQIALASTFMTPSIVSNNSTSGTGTSVVLTKPSSVTWNTTLIVSISVNGTQTITPASGFTLIDTGTRAGTTTRVYIKNLGTTYASEPSSYTFTLSGSVAYIGQILNIKNLKSSATPLDTNNNTNGSSTTATVASMSPVASSSGIYLWIGGIPSGGTTFSTPSGWTSYNVVSSVSARQHIFYKTFTSGTTSGVANSTLSASVEWATVGVTLTANLF